MTTAAPTPDPEWLALGAGQTGLHWLAAGTTLVALEGSLHLEPPSRGTTEHYALGAGHAHVVEMSGWWHLHADTRSGAHLRVVAPALRTQRPAWPAMWRWVANWAQPRGTLRG
jgi:hypothetical protein